LVCGTLIGVGLRVDNVYLGSKRDMSYREIIKANIRAVMKKKENSEEKSDYWDWIISELIADLRDYEGGLYWRSKIRDSEWLEHRVPVDILTFLREFFGSNFY